MSPKPARSQLVFLPVSAPDREWPQVRRYRLVRLPDRSLLREGRQENRVQTPPHE